MTIKYIYFDLDNTLLDHNKAESKSHEAIYNDFEVLRAVSLNNWLTSYKSINHKLWIQYQDGEIGREQLQYSRFNTTMAELGLEPDESEEIGLAYMNKYRNYWEWIDNAEETLKLISQNFDVGIITNGFKETQQMKFEKLALEKYTDQMIISEDLGVLKPHPKIFNHATELAGVSREEILYVGDSYSSDVIGGTNAGWKTAWYTGFSTETEAEIQPNFKFDEFSDLQRFLNLI